MTYEPLATPEYLSAPSLNKLAAELDADLASTLEGYVLPHRTPDKPTYEKREAVLYVPRREWIADLAIHVGGSQSYRYERAFHEILWRSEEHPSYHRKRLIFLSGTVGSGKSTFVDYYFRCYCPSLPARMNRYTKKSCST